MLREVRHTSLEPLDGPRPRSRSRSRPGKQRGAGRAKRVSRRGDEMDVFGECGCNRRSGLCDVTCASETPIRSPMIGRPSLGVQRRRGMCPASGCKIKIPSLPPTPAAPSRSPRSPPGRPPARTARTPLPSRSPASPSARTGPWPRHHTRGVSSLPALITLVPPGGAHRAAMRFSSVSGAHVPPGEGRRPSHTPAGRRGCPPSRHTTLTLRHAWACASHC